MSHPNVKIRPSAGPVIDRSGTIAAAATSQTVMAENPSRAYLLFQNISDTTMWVNFGSAAAADSTSIQVLAGGAITFNSGWVPTDAVNVLCATDTKAFVAKEGQ